MFVLGVSVLTSQPASEDQVTKLVKLAIKSGISGVIASAQEYKAIRSMSKDIKIFVLEYGPNDKKHDQQRYVSYSEFCKIAKNDNQLMPS